MAQVVMTIGHSTRTIEEFISLLQAFAIKHLVDVRTVPRSRRNPQFNRDSLPQSLAPAAIDYTHLSGLGGLRRPLSDSPNSGWRNDSFRGYADYMQTEAFEESLDELLRLAEQSRTVIMCAEAVPWRCHRSLIADALIVRAVSVEHILSATRHDPHRLTSFARVDGRRITYPSPAQTVDQQQLPLDL